MFQLSWITTFGVPYLFFFLHVATFLLKFSSEPNVTGPGSITADSCCCAFSSPKRTQTNNDLLRLWSTRCALKRRTRTVVHYFFFFDHFFFCFDSETKQERSNNKKKSTAPTQSLLPGRAGKRFPLETGYRYYFLSGPMNEKERKKGRQRQDESSVKH